MVVYFISKPSVGELVLEPFGTLLLYVIRRSSWSDPIIFFKKMLRKNVQGKSAIFGNLLYYYMEPGSNFSGSFY